MAMFSKLSWQKKTRGADLTDGEFRVLMMLSTWSDKHGRNAHPGNRQLADACLMSERAVRRITKRLTVKGWVSLDDEGGNQYGKGSANVYSVTSPKGDPAVPLQPESERAPKGDPTSTKGDPTSRGRGTQQSPHQILSSDPSHHSARKTSRDHSAERSRPNPSWEELADDELLLEWLNEELDGIDAHEESTAIGMCATGEHPKAILNTLQARRTPAANANVGDRCDECGKHPDAERHLPACSKREPIVCDECGTEAALTYQMGLRPCTDCGHHRDDLKDTA